MREGGGGSPLSLLTVHFPPFPWLRMNFVLFTELSEKRGVGGRKRRGGQSENGRKPLLSDVTVSQTCIHSPF